MALGCSAGPKCYRDWRLADLIDADQFGSDLAKCTGAHPDFEAAQRNEGTGLLNHNTRRRSMKALFVRFVREESGQDLIEYGLLIGIITIGCITAIQSIGPKVAGYFTSLDGLLP